MSWTRASSLARAMACPGSTVLPVEDLRGGSAREAAAWGTMAHRWAATGEIRSEEGFKGHARLFWKKVRALWTDLEGVEAARAHLWPDDGLHEVSVAIDCRGPSPIVAWEHVADPDAWKAQFGPEYITGTIDYLGDLLGDPWVDDLKTGRIPVHPSEPQPMLYTLAAWVIKDRPPRAVTSITHWPRYPVMSYPDRVDIEVSDEMLDSFYRECRISYIEHGAARGASLEYFRPGPHCRFCPSRRPCPADLGEFS